MRVLVTGAAGMLGHRVVAEARGRGWEAVGVDLPDGDLTDPELARALIADEHPDAVVHCAAWTDVDGAEASEQAAFAVNATASHNVAIAADEIGARLVAVSTDYVFDGRLTGRPYVESDPTAPLGAYGRTKLAGEQAIARVGGDHVIARTAWLFGAGGKNFPDTMLTLGRERDQVSVVTDQTGSPTWTGHLAPALLDLCDLPLQGVVHTAGSGQCTWHQLCVELYTQAALTTTINETTAAAFNRPAPRPSWSVLATQRTNDRVPVLPAWQHGLTGHLNDRNTP